MFDDLPEESIDSYDDYETLGNANLGEVAASNWERKKSFPSWKQEVKQKQNFKRGNFRNEQRMERKQDRFTLLIKTPKEIIALGKRKFKPPSSMTTSVEKRNASKFCEFHGEVGHTTDECIHLKRQIEEMLKAEKPWKRPDKDSKKGGNLRERQTAGNINGEEDGTKGPMIIKAEMGGHCVHRIYARGKEDPSNPIHEARNDKIPMAGGIVTLWSSMIIPLENSMVSEPRVPRSVINQVTKEKIQVAIHPKYPEQTIAIGSTITEEGRKELCGLLRRHLDVFSWKPTDMTGVARHIAEHRRNVHEGCLPARQKRGEDVKKLIEANIMKEVHYHNRLSNPLMELIMYLAAAKEAISAVLMTERDRIKYPFTSLAILPGTYNSCNHGSTNKTTTVQSGGNGKAAQMEIRTRRARHSVPTKDVSKRKNSSGLHHGAFRGRHTRYINGGQGRTPRPMDIIHERIIMHRGFGAGLIITNPKGMEFTYALRFRFNATNNEAKYKALIAGLRIAGGENKKADALSKITSTSFAHLSKQVLVKELREKAIDEKEILEVVEEEGHTWMTSVYEYLTKGILPEEKKKARAMRRKAGRYALINEVLYKNPSLAYGCGPRFVVAKALRSGYYWLTIHTDARNLIRECNDCQEKREQATVQEARSKAKMGRYYNARVRNISFRLGDFVYQNNEASHEEDGGKLGPK
nr:reverse transcriptase domain-containing protein [Tanacetum cinerariifolium]